MQEYSTSIAIGGVLPKAALPGLLAAAVHCGTAFDWNADRLVDNDADLCCLQDIIEDSARRSEPLRLYNDVAGWGRLEALETFCREHGLNYRREHDPDNGESGMVCWWSPGMKEPTERPADSDGEPFVYVRDIVEATASARTDKAAMAAVRDLLRRTTPVEIGALTLRDD